MTSRTAPEAYGSHTDPIPSAEDPEIEIVSTEGARHQKLP